MICVTTVPDLEYAEAPVASPPGDNKLLGAELCRCKNRKLRLFRQPRIWQPRIRHLEAIEPPAISTPKSPVTTEPIVSTNIGLLTDSPATLYAMAPCLFFGTEIRSQQFKTLLDSGASHNFIPKWIVERLGLQMRRLPTPVYTLIADGTSKAVTHFVRVNMRIGSFRFRTRCRVMEDNPYLLLGMNFLAKYNPQICWKTRTLLLTTWNHVHVIPALQSSQFPSSISQVDQAKGRLPPPRGVQLMSVLPCEELQISPSDRVAVEELCDEAKINMYGKPKADSTPLDTTPIPEVVKQVLSKFQDIFPENLPLGLPAERATDHAIDIIPGARPPGHRIYRMSPAEDAELKKQLDAYLAAGQIEPAQSPFGAGVLFARKKDATLRLCIDYRSLNNITVKDKYPLPRIDEILDNMAGCRYFSKMDLHQGYHQIRIKPQDIPKTAFQTKYGSFQFRVMPFGLTNAPATFQRMMNQIMQKHREFADVYLDDIIIHSRSLEEHAAHIAAVLETLREEKLFAKLRKCEFARNSIEFCGHIVSEKGISTMPTKLKSIEDWPVPKNPSDIKSFLGLCGFYQKFIRRYADITVPLTELLKKSVKWKWGQEQQQSFEELKSALLKSAELAYPNWSEPFVVHLDASKFAIGATLSQKDTEENLRLLACTSRKMNPAEQNYPTHEREMLALVDSLKRWKHYLQGSKVEAFTDNSALRFWKTIADPSPRQVRWLAYISTYNIDLKHIPGVTNTAADALSRLPTLMPMVEEEVDWTSLYIADQAIGPLYYVDGRLQNPRTFHNGRLWLDDKIIVPEVKISSVIAAHHDSVLAGHWGTQKTYDILQRKFSFPLMKKKVQQFVQSCDICQRCKHEHQLPRGMLEPLSLPMQKWHSISIDWIWVPPLIRYGRDYDRLLVVTDRATKMTHLIPSNAHETAEDTAELLLNFVFKYHGLPRSIHSDRAPVLMSETWDQICRRLDIKLRATSAFHPQGNGQAERTNQTVKTLLRVARHYNKDWFDVLATAEMALNSAPIAKTKFSPYRLNYGFDPVTIPDVFSYTNASAREDEEPDSFIDRLNTEWKLSHRLLRKLKGDQVDQANKHRQVCRFKVGDEVLVIRSKRLLGRQDPKGPLAPPKSGPFKIIGQITETSFRLKLPPKYKNISDAFHADQLVPYHARVEAAPNAEPIPPRLAADEEIVGEDDPMWDPIAAPPILPNVAPPPNANDPPAPPLRKMQKVQVSSGDWIEVLQEPEIYGRNAAGEIEVVIPPHAPAHEEAQRVPHIKIEPADDMQNVEIADVPVTIFRTKPKDAEDVMLNPLIFHQARKFLQFKPSVDMFATTEHHQVPRYFSPIADANAAGVDAFMQNWAAENTPYANPPWSLIPRVLQKIRKEEIRMMLVIPDWTFAPWYKNWEALCEKYIVFTEPVYLTADGKIRPKPWWHTKVGILNGSLQRNRKPPREVTR